MSKATKRDGRGRPQIFKGNLAKAIVKSIRSIGLTKTRQVFEEKGLPVVEKVGEKAKVIKMKVSMPTLGVLAKRAGVELKRGRPEKVAA